MIQPDRINKIISKLEDARNRPVAELERDLDEAQLLIVELRDSLIERLRRDERNGELRNCLDRSNLALSMIIGLEYPLGGFHREKIKQAEKVVKELCPPVEAVRG